MDSSSSDSDSEELLPIVRFNELAGEGEQDPHYYEYDDPLLVTGVLRVVVEGDLERLKCVVESGKSVNINDNNGNTPLHVAVIKNFVPILEYLLSREEIVVNSRNFSGETPLYKAVKNGRFESAKKLIEAGANVNLPNCEDVMPLHVSIAYPDIALMLIKHEAIIDALDYCGDTPLHDATAEECLETVCMLLYYNADANAVGGNQLTPFMKALISENVKIQQALFEYVDDFNATTRDNMTTLALALTHNTPYVEEIINRGADVNYASSFLEDEFTCAFLLCLRVPNQKKFKLIWERLEYNNQTNSINLYTFFKYLHRPMLDRYIEVIVDSDNIKVAVESFTKNENFFLFVNKFAAYNLDLDILTKLTCRLLLNGYRLNTYDVYSVFFNYGYCELFRILLYMENNYMHGWLPNMAMPRAIIDVNYKLSSIVDMGVNIHRKELESLIEYFVYPPLISTHMIFYNDDDDMMQKILQLPKVPLLVELARNKAREYIAQKFKPTNSCQFYTILNHLNISRVYKKILTFEKKLYKIKVPNQA